MATRSGYPRPVRHCPTSPVPAPAFQDLCIFGHVAGEDLCRFLGPYPPELLGQLRIVVRGPLVVPFRQLLVVSCGVYPLDLVLLFQALSAPVHRWFVKAYVDKLTQQALDNALRPGYTVDKFQVRGAITLVTKQRSPNYPGVDLETAVSLTTKLYSRVGKGEFNPTDAAGAWDYAGPSGPVRVRLGRVTAVRPYRGQEG